MAALGAAARLLRCQALSRSASPFLNPCRGIAYKLFVGGLSFFTSDKTLHEAFGQFGQIVEAGIVMDKVTERSKGFGFVTYASEDEAEKALFEMNGKELDGRIIHVDRAKVKAQINYSRPPIARGPPEPSNKN